MRPDLNAANRPNLPPLHTAAQDGNHRRDEELRREEHEEGEDQKVAARRVSGDETPRHDNLAETENEHRSEGSRSNQDDDGRVAAKAPARFSATRRSDDDDARRRDGDDRYDQGAATRRSDNESRRRDDGDRFDRDENNNRGEGRAKAPTVSDDIDIDNTRDRPGDLPPSVIVHPLPDATIKESIDDMDERNQHQRGQARRRDQVHPSEDEDPPEPARYSETARHQPDIDTRDRRPQAHDAPPRDRARTDDPGRSSSMNDGGRGRAERPTARFAQDDDRRRANGDGRTIPEDVSELQFDSHPLEPPQAAARGPDYHQRRDDDLTCGKTVAQWDHLRQCDEITPLATTTTTTCRKTSLQRDDHGRRRGRGMCPATIRPSLRNRVASTEGEAAIQNRLSTADLTTDTMTMMCLCIGYQSTEMGTDSSRSEIRLLRLARVTGERSILTKEIVTTKHTRREGVLVGEKLWIAWRIRVGLGGLLDLLATQMIVIPLVVGRVRTRTLSMRRCNHYGGQLLLGIVSRVVSRRSTAMKVGCPARILFWEATNRDVAIPFRRMLVSAMRLT